MAVERREKFLGYVRRGGESETDVGVGVTLEVRLHGFEKSEDGGRKTGKFLGVCKARRGIGIRCWCRGDVGGKAPPLEETLKSW